MPPRRSSRRGHGSHNVNQDPPVNPEIIAAVNQAITSMIPTLVTQLADAIRQQPSPGAGQTSPDDEIGNLNDAENWISHMDKIFDVLGCPDNQKVRLAAYKLEGDAYRWWRTLKEVKGGDAFVDSLTWDGFRELFYQQYLSASDRDAYAREYASIQQRDKESVIDYLARFVRLAGLAGVAAGSTRDQAEKFKWSLQGGIRARILSMKFVDVAEAANAAKDIERDRLEHQAKKEGQSKKRDHPYQRDQIGKIQEIRMVRMATICRDRCEILVRLT